MCYGLLPGIYLVDFCDIHMTNARVDQMHGGLVGVMISGCT